MGSIISAIHDDIEDYEFLCKHFGEEVQRKATANGSVLPDCYGTHSKELEDRLREEQKNKKNKKKEPEIRSLQMRIGYGRAPSFDPMELYEHAMTYVKGLGFDVIETDPVEGVCVGKEDVWLVAKVVRGLPRPTTPS